jgi:hypothetical protein
MKHNIFFACFGLALGFMMGWQLKTQESPAAAVAAQTFQNSAAIVHIQRLHTPKGKVVIHYHGEKE